MCQNFAPYPIFSAFLSFLMLFQFIVGDVIVLLRAVGAAEYASSNGALGEFCLKNGLNKKAITEIRKLRKQVTNEMNLTIAELQLVVDPQMKPPSDLQVILKFVIVLVLDDLYPVNCQD